jgi:hypothetical protein
MNLEIARTIADAVMMEGYALYPYRASAAKNRYRWTFGVLAPRAWSEAGGCEPWWLEAQLLVAGEPTRIAGQLRFFHIDRREDDGGRWDEGIARAIQFEVGARAEQVFAVAGSHVRDGAARRVCAPIRGRLAFRREQVEADRPLARVTIRVENTTPFAALDAPRDHALASAFASTHLLLGVDGGELVSAIDPPPWAQPAAAACTNTRTYPVLVGPPGTRDVALCAPFVLYDHPQIAPESACDLCDATEIDELLLLRTRTLTDEEKRLARATDPRSAAIIDRADALPREALERLHGTTRDLRAGEMIPRTTPIAIGAKVRLRRPARRTDAQDVLYAGHVATVAAIKHDVDGTVFHAVTIDDDPAAELHGWYGRYHYYRRDEVDPL